MALHTGEKMMLLRSHEGAGRIGPAADRLAASLDRISASKLAGLETAAVATEGAEGFPDIEVLVAPRGFLKSEGEGARLRVDQPVSGVPGDVTGGAALALLALFDGPRSRFRLSGRVLDNDGTGINVGVAQHFTADARYLPEWERRPATHIAQDDVPAGRQPRADLDDEMQAFLADADVMLVASRTPVLDGADGNGLDISLRAGLPGFVQRIDAAGFAWPEYPGSEHFSTLGNLLLDGRCTLLVTATGRSGALELTGHATIAWKNAVAQETGSEYAVEFKPRTARFVPDRFGAIYRLRNYAPDLLEVPLPEAPPRRMRITRRAAETRDAVSLYLQDALKRPLRPLPAGQYLTLTLPDGQTRDYTISSFSPRPSGYRITAKLYELEKGGGGGSAQIHALGVDDEVEVRGPRGAFVLPRTLDRPIVMISSGIGITPMIAFAEELAWRARQHPVWFIHGARNGASMVFARSLRALRNELPNARWHLRFSQPRGDDRLETDFQSIGRVDAALVQELLPLGSYDFYLCGPDPFIAAMARGLRACDVPGARIHAESFRIGSDEEGGADEPEAGADELPELFPRRIRFTRSGQEAVWEPERGTLLEFAEQIGIRAPHSCRTGMCGECAQKLVSGTVVPVQATPFTPKDGEILLCSTVPLSDAEIDL